MMKSRKNLRSLPLTVIVGLLVTNLVTGCSSVQTPDMTNFSKANISSLESQLQLGIKQNIEKIGPIGGKVKMAYITKEELKDPEFKKDRSKFDHNNTHFGALRFNDSKTGEDGRLFLLKQTKGTFMAETRMNEDEDKRYFVSFGVNPDDSAPYLGFRLEF